MFVVDFVVVVVLVVAVVVVLLVVVLIVVVVSKKMSRALVKVFLFNIKTIKNSFRYRHFCEKG